MTGLTYSGLYDNTILKWVMWVTGYQSVLYRRQDGFKFGYISDRIIWK